MTFRIRPMHWILVGGVAVALLWARRAKGNSRMTLTNLDLKKIDPRVKTDVADAVNAMLQAANCTTVPRMAAMLAQTMHESGGYFYVRELASGEAYEGRKDLGNTQLGDGKRFKGRGYLMLTGRANYSKFAQETGVDVLSDPTLLEDPTMAGLSAAWFWKEKGLNTLADAGNFDGITRRINGGLTHKAERDVLYRRALKVLSDLEQV